MWRLWLIVASLAGVTSIIMGAFAAHPPPQFSGVELSTQHIVALRTGSLYALIHAVALIGIASLAAARAPLANFSALLMSLGILLFSGSLFAFPFSAGDFGILTPIGGLFLAGGWLALLWTALRFSLES